MNLFNILNDKGGEVITVQTADTLQKAAQLLHDKRIGATVALDARGKVAGMLSERDIIRCVAEAGREALNLQVSDAMTEKVVTARPDMSVEEGLELMTDRRIRHLPVLREADLVGIVSIGDLVKRKISSVEAEAEAMKQYIATG